MWQLYLMLLVSSLPDHAEHPCSLPAGETSLALCSTRTSTHTKACASEAKTLLCHAHQSRATCAAIHSMSMYIYTASSCKVTYKTVYSMQVLTAIQNYQGWCLSVTFWLDHERQQQEPAQRLPHSQEQPVGWRRFVVSSAGFAFAGCASAMKSSTNPAALQSYYPILASHCNAVTQEQNMIISHVWTRCMWFSNSFARSIWTGKQFLVMYPKQAGHELLSFKLRVRL